MISSTPGRHHSASRVWTRRRGAGRFAGVHLLCFVVVLAKNGFVRQKSPGSSSAVPASETDLRAASPTQEGEYFAQ
jgi:hypothetical protein